jgi:hypothetical protein
MAALVVGLSLSACGGSPAAPTPPPILSADIRLSGQGSWTGCFLGDCFFSASIENVGAGCASGTSLVARLFDASNQQVGSDIQMGGSGSSLSARTIRPQEVVAVTSLLRVSADFIARSNTYRLFPAWNNVAC